MWTLKKIQEKQTRWEEWCNAFSHIIGALLGIAALVILVHNGAALHSPIMVISSAVYGASLIIMYTASSLYHIVPYFTAKKRLKLFDHCSIYILIAGSYTPFALVSMAGYWGWWVFYVIWGLAITGVTFKLFFIGRFQRLSLIIYILMGWLAIIVIKPLIHGVGRAGLLWLLGGGLCYTVGVIFFVLDHKYRFSHFMWHLCVLAGSIFQFFAILFYVIV